MTACRDLRLNCLICMGRRLLLARQVVRQDVSLCSSHPDAAHLCSQAQRARHRRSLVPPTLSSPLRDGPTLPLIPAGALQHHPAFLSTISV